MRLKQVVTFIFAVLIGLATCQTNSWDNCEHDLRSATGFKKKLSRFISKINPFNTPEVKMQFYLYKQAFPHCGEEIRMDDDSLQTSAFNASHPTRIVIHGWMSQSKSDLNRAVRDGYLSLGDFNVIIVDWSMGSRTINYYKVASLIESFGTLLAEFTKHLHDTMGADYDNMYLIGHSLGAQIAGSAGKQIKPDMFNTIFALDPAGPAFKEKSEDYRIDATDAKYVESIQTSHNFGFEKPVGHASFFPNKGSQSCNSYGCSHRRSYKFFAESLTSTVGFWGTRCYDEKEKWHCPGNGEEFKMGGDPSEPKNGTFYVKTRSKPPYALGKFYKDDDVV